MWVTSRWIIDRLKYLYSKFNMHGRRGENDAVTALGRWAVREHRAPDIFLVLGVFHSLK